MEVVEASQIRLESVMDPIDMKMFGIMAAIGKIELDNIRERTSMGKRGAAKQGRIPNGRVPYGYRIGEDGKPEIVEEEGEIVRWIYRQYVREGLGASLIAKQLHRNGVLTSNFGTRWHEAQIHRLLARESYKAWGGTTGLGAPLWTVTGGSMSEKATSGSVSRSHRSWMSRHGNWHS